MPGRAKVQALYEDPRLRMPAEYATDAQRFDLRAT